MRIALLCPNASGNGLVRTYPIAKVLARHHDLQFLGFRFSEGLFAPYKDELPLETMLAASVPRFWRQAYELALRVRADAVYAFKTLPSSYWVGLLARRIHRIPLFLDIEDWEMAWYHDHTRTDRLRQALHLEQPNGPCWTWISEKLAPLADETFVVSRFLQQRFGGTLLVHGADTAFFDPSRWSRSEALERLGLPRHRYVVFTGSPTRRKGLLELLNAVAALGARDVRVLIVGSFQNDPAYQSDLMSIHGDRLMLVGPRPHAEMPLWLAVADVVALPQRVSAATMAQVPGKVFEAMAMARPIIATAASDLPEILDGCGIVTPPGSEDALREGLEWVLSRPKEAAALGHAARSRCQDRYSWDAMDRTLSSVLGRWVAAP